jgi:2-polyprenyl-3-methyl-5-hydroxy-6-metoxy-1,4-benzoquinol methylase
MAGIDQDILSSWDANAGLWTSAVRGATIPSRAAGTDQAIVDAIKSLQPKRLVDIGCGEGWLVRRLADELDCEITGIDGGTDLINTARTEHETGRYLILSYDAIVGQPGVLAGPYDVAVFNFSLLAEDISSLLRATRIALAPGGAMVIQTVHPWTALGEGAYADGWREETFAAFATFESGEWKAMPWFYRTMGSCFAQFEIAGLAVAAVSEPLNQETGRPLSIIFTVVPRE